MICGPQAGAPGKPGFGLLGAKKPSPASETPLGHFWHRHSCLCGMKVLGDPAPQAPHKVSPGRKPRGVAYSHESSAVDAAQNWVPIRARVLAGLQQRLL